MIFAIISKTGKLLYRSNELDFLKNYFENNFLNKPGYKLVEIISEMIDPDNKGSFINTENPPKKRDKTKIKVNHLLKYTNIKEIKDLCK